MNNLNSAQFVLGIGCSAGGVEALKEIVGDLPVENIAYVVMQHLSPDHESHMADILSPLTHLDVREAKHGDRLISGSMLMTPPGLKMMIKDEKVVLEKYEKDEQRIPLHSIDTFFQSLAIEYEDNAAVLVMSGSGNDGTRGCLSIKERGGYVLVQSPNDSKFTSMPSSIIEAGLCDLESSTLNIAKSVSDLFEMSYKSRDTAKILSENESEFDHIVKLISTSIGVDFSRYKVGTLARRIAKRVALTRSTHITNYRHKLEIDRKEVELLANDFFIGVTSFFRDTEYFEALKRDVLPELVKSANSDNIIRIWVPACSTGEEAYSIAIIIDEAIKKLSKNIDYRIFGSDVDPRAIVKAQEARYTTESLVDIDDDYRSEYFTEVGDGKLEVSKKIREKVVFSKHDLLSDPPFTKIDLVSFRNCSIYLDKNAQREIMQVLEHCLNVDGYLFLGSSESAPTSSSMKTINKKAKIFKKVNKDSSSKIIKILQSRNARSKEIKKGSIKQLKGSKDFNQKIQKVLIEKFLPATIVASMEGLLLHVAGDVKRFVTVNSGSVSGSIYDFLIPELKTPVTVGLRRFQSSEFKKSGKTKVFSTVKSSDDPSQSIEIEFTQSEIDNESNVFIITLKGSEDRATNNFIAPKAHKELVDDLLSELDQSRKDLNFTVEDLETTNEELQSSNEELVTSNEELQSVNEELQSVNEELYTMNNEYQSKIDEISESRRDMDALLEVANIGTMFLDSSLVIRKLSDRLKNVMGFRDGDIGRKVSDFSQPLYREFYDDCETVLKTRKQIEHQIKLKGEGWSLLKIRPYDTFENEKNGVVVLLIDISELKAMRQSQDLLFKFLLSSDEVSFGVNEVGNIDYWTDSAASLFKIEREKAIGLHESVFLPLKAQSDLSVIRNQAEKGQPIYLSGTYRLTNDDDEIETTLIGHGRYSSKGKLIGVRYTLFKTGDSSPIDIRLKKELRTLRTLLEVNPMAIVVLDENGAIEYANDFACSLLELNRDDFYQRSYNTPVWKLMDLEGNLLEDSQIPFKKVIEGRSVVTNNKIMLDTGMGKTISICVSGAPVWEEDELKGAIMSFYEINE